MAGRTRARVFALTLAWWLTTRDTVWWETPASAATWFRVGARDRMSAPCGVLRCGAGKRMVGVRWSWLLFPDMSPALHADEESDGNSGCQRLTEQATSLTT